MPITKQTTQEQEDYGPLPESVHVFWDNLAFHPVADYFPLIELEEFDDLVESIRENGIQVPIVLDKNGKILDGRNRYAALVKVKDDAAEMLKEEDVPYVYRPDLDTQEKISNFIKDANIHRRHLTAQQRVALVHRITKWDPDKAASRGRPSAGKPVMTQQQIAEEAGVSVGTVKAEQAKLRGKKPSGKTQAEKQAAKKEVLEKKQADLEEMEEVLIAAKDPDDAAVKLAELQRVNKALEDTNIRLHQEVADLKAANDAKDLVIAELESVMGCVDSFFQSGDDAETREAKFKACVDSKKKPAKKTRKAKSSG